MRSRFFACVPPDQAWLKEVKVHAQRESRHPKRRCGVFVATALTAAFALFPAGQSTAANPDASNPFRTGRTLVIPHGGGDGVYPENTLLAYAKTMAMGADAVDVDVRLSSDGIPVLIHDADTLRTTGRQGKVSAMTASQLAKLDAGWSFGTKTHPFRNTNTHIPTLETILQRFPKALLSIDLKDESMNMIKPVCELLRAYNRRNDVFVGSNNDAQILAFRERCPDVRTSATMVDVYASRDARASGAKDFVSAVGVDQPPYRSGGRTLVDKASLDFAHAHGIAVLTWVVNDPADMQHLVDIGVDGIYTSYPDRLLKILRR